VRSTGIDFGRWTTWQRPITSPLPIDFVIAGLTSGTYNVGTYAKNMTAIKKEKRGMLYHFFEPGNAILQADVASRAMDESGAKALWLDWETTKNHRLTLADVETFSVLYQTLKERYPRVGMYSNHEDMWFMQRENPDLAETIEWWLAYPSRDMNQNEYHYLYKSRIARPFESVRFLQYSWWGDAKAYGVTNENSAMDLNVYMGNVLDLDEWLGVQPDEPVDFTAELREIDAKLAELREKVGELIAKQGG